MSKTMKADVDFVINELTLKIAELTKEQVIQNALINKYQAEIDSLKNEINELKKGGEE